MKKCDKLCRSASYFARISANIPSLGHAQAVCCRYSVQVSRPWKQMERARVWTGIPIVGIFQTRSLGFTCRIWLAHSLEVHSPTPQSNRTDIGFFIILIWFSELLLFPSWYTLLAASEGMRELLVHPGVLELFCFTDIVQLFIASTVSDVVLSSLLCGLTCFWRAMSLQLQSRSVAPSRLIATAEGWKGQSRIFGQRGQGKQGREWNSPEFSVFCWVVLCVMRIWGSWGYFEALGSMLLCP